MVVVVGNEIICVSACVGWQKGRGFSPSRVRTGDLAVNSHTLYQLSYRRSTALYPEPVSTKPCTTHDLQLRTPIHTATLTTNQNPTDHNTARHTHRAHTTRHQARAPRIHTRSTTLIHFRIPSSPTSLRLIRKCTSQGQVYPTSIWGRRAVPLLKTHTLQGIPQQNRLQRTTADAHACVHRMLVTSSAL